MAGCRVGSGTVTAEVGELGWLAGTQVPAVYTVRAGTAVPAGTEAPAGTGAPAGTRAALAGGTV